MAGSGTLSTFPKDLCLQSVEAERPLCAVCSTITFSQLESPAGFCHRKVIDLPSNDLPTCPLCGILRAVVEENGASSNYGVHERVTMRVYSYMKNSDIHVQVIDDRNLVQQNVTENQGSTQLVRAIRSLRVDLLFTAKQCDKYLSFVAKPETCK